MKPHRIDAHTGYCTACGEALAEIIEHDTRCLTEGEWEEIQQSALESVVRGLMDEHPPVLVCLPGGRN